MLYKFWLTNLDDGSLHLECADVKGLTLEGRELEELLLRARATCRAFNKPDDTRVLVKLFRRRKPIKESEK